MWRLLGVDEFDEVEYAVDFIERRKRLEHKTHLTVWCCNWQPGH